MFIDTHCHLDAWELREDLDAVIAAASDAGVSHIVIPAVHRENFARVRTLAHQFAGGRYALGIHPMYVADSTDADLVLLADEVERAMADRRFVAIGEIGLDFFIDEIASGPARERQEYFYQEQLKLAHRFGLPVLLHVRRSQDVILKYLRRFPEIGGIAHAFNGSDQQAAQFVKQGFALGIGGAMTFTRARQIRRLAAQIPLANLVLETDSPDIPPAWLDGPNPRNTPDQVPAIASALAALRNLDPQEIARQTSATATRVIPRLMESSPASFE